MKLPYLIAVFFVLLFAAAQRTIAQTKPLKMERQVLASTGAGIILADMLQVEYTVGEAVIVPLTAVTGTVLTQGFQQPPTGRITNSALNEDLVLYPNPALDDVSIKFTLDTTAKKVDIRIVNIMGQLMFTDKLDAPTPPREAPFIWTITYSFNTNTLRLIPGIYIFQMKTNTGFSVTKKFLKMK
jgi:hypothetical protein